MTLFQEYITSRDSNLLKLHISQRTLLGWFVILTVETMLRILSLIYIYVVFFITIVSTETFENKSSRFYLTWVFTVSNGDDNPA